MSKFYQSTKSDYFKKIKSNNKYINAEFVNENGLYGSAYGWYEGVEGKFYTWYFDELVKMLN